MTPRPSMPLEQMTDAEVRAWKEWLLEEGKKPRPFAWARAHQNPENRGAKVPESQSAYEPALGKVIECSADGKRYIVGVRNAELQRLQELKDDDGKSGLFPNLRRLTSR